MQFANKVRHDVTCNRYDPLLLQAILRHKHHITYRDELGKQKQNQELMQDVKSGEGAEYMKLEKGTII